jgi:hypothetical protein
MDTRYAVRMLLPEEVRRVDPALASLSDEELAEAVRLLEGLAEVALANWFRCQQECGSKLPPGVLPFLKEPVP